MGPLLPAIGGGSTGAKCNFGNPSMPALELTNRGSTGRLK
jgi:hypothetical protein